MLQKGDQFPQFELENQDGELVSNETLKGSKAILYFYPLIIFIKYHQMICHHLSCHFLCHVIT